MTLWPRRLASSCEICRESSSRNWRFLAALRERSWHAGLAVTPDLVARDPSIPEVTVRLFGVRSAGSGIFRVMIPCQLRVPGHTSAFFSLRWFAGSHKGPSASGWAREGAGSQGPCR